MSNDCPPKSTKLITMFLGIDLQVLSLSGLKYSFDSLMTKMRMLRHVK